MRELYGAGLASRTDPESCVDRRKAGHEALTGAHAGGVSLPALRRQASVVRAACSNAARADLCGRRWATGVPTATECRPVLATLRCAKIFPIAKRCHEKRSTHC